MNLEWMAWTPVTAGFFIVIFILLVCMTIWEISSPAVLRKGLLPIATTRGDRFFIGLLGSGYITIAWIGFTDITLWYSLPISICYLILMMRYG